MAIVGIKELPGKTPIDDCQKDEIIVKLKVKEPERHLVELIGSTYRYEIHCSVPSSNSEDSPGLHCGLLAHYPLDNNVDENSGSGNRGSLNGPIFVQGKVGHALRFDGEDDFVDLGDHLDLGDKDLSISFWMRTTQTTGWRTVQKRGTGPSSKVSGWQISGRGGSFVNTYFTDGTGKSVHFSRKNYRVNDGNWHHVVVTWSNSTSSLSLYIDGKFKEEGIRVGNPSGMNIETGRHLTFGAAWDRGSKQRQHFKGELDDVWVYDRILSVDEMRMISEFCGVTSCKFDKNGKIVATDEPDGENN